MAIKEWDAQKAKKSGLPPVYDLGGWLTIECPTGDRTSQSSVSTLATGYGPNAARPRNVDKVWGLSVESKRTNEVSYSDAWGAGVLPVDDPDPGWAKSSMAITTAIGPGLGTAATVFDSSGSQQSNYTSVPKGYASAWLKGAGAAMPFARFVVDPDAEQPWDTLVDVIDTDWRRYEIADASGYLRLETRADGDGNPPAITTPSTISAYGAQLEPGVMYPSSYISTQEMKRTREADKLYVNGPSAIAPNGFFHLRIRFSTNYAAGEPKAAEHDLFWVDKNNRIFLRFMDNKIVLRINGQDITSLPITWAREQEITVEAIHSSTERRLTVSGAAPSDFSGAPLSDKPLSLLAPFYILGNDAGAQECADLRYIGFFPLE